jgi:hypothetical protein
VPDIGAGQCIPVVGKVGIGQGTKLFISPASKDGRIAALMVVVLRSKAPVFLSSSS